LVSVGLDLESIGQQAEDIFGGRLVYDNTSNKQDKSRSNPFLEPTSTKLIGKVSCSRK